MPRSKPLIWAILVIAVVLVVTVAVVDAANNPLPIHRISIKSSEQPSSQVVQNISSSESSTSTEQSKHEAECQVYKDLNDNHGNVVQVCVGNHGVKVVVKQGDSDQTHEYNLTPKECDKLQNAQSQWQEEFQQQMDQLQHMFDGMEFGTNEFPFTNMPQAFQDAYTKAWSDFQSNWPDNQVHVC